ERPNLSEDSNEVIDAVTEQVRNTYIMVENLLEWFRSQQGGLTLHPQTWELAGIVQEAVHMMRIKGETKHIAIQIRIDEDMRVFADREAVNLIVRNLLSNALKFTQQGGLVCIEAKKLGGMAVVSVCDNGVGMERE